MVTRAGKMRILAVDGEEVARNAVVSPHSGQLYGVRGRDLPELRTPLRVRRGDIRHPQVVNHPPLIPATLVVDHEQAADVREDIDERAWIIGIAWQARLRLQSHAHRAESGEATVRSPD